MKGCESWKRLRKGFRLREKEERAGKPEGGVWATREA